MDMITPPRMRRSPSVGHERDNGAGGSHHRQPPFRQRRQRREASNADSSESRYNAFMLTRLYRHTAICSTGRFSSSSLRRQLRQYESLYSRRRLTHKVCRGFTLRFRIAPVSRRFIYFRALAIDADASDRLSNRMLRFAASRITPAFSRMPQRRRFFRFRFKAARADDAILLRRRHRRPICSPPA